MHKKTISVLFSNILGNTMEWYDFALYGSLAPIIAQLFFPSKNSLASLVLTFGVFASGFLMRPLGGIIFGHIGDRYGRKKALLTSILLMTIPTVLLGLIPSYETWGIFASLSLTFLRLVQGVAVGGEFTGSMSYLVEIAPYLL
jgi:MHS family proline/betaine transporter-like MFS transporter